MFEIRDYNVITGHFEVLSVLSSGEAAEDFITTYTQHEKSAEHVVYVFCEVEREER